MKVILGIFCAALAVNCAAADVAPAGGEATFRGICQGCHMPDGRGAEGAGRYPALAGNPRLAAAAYPVYVVLNGRHGMPPWGDVLDDGQVADVVNYVRTHFGNAFADVVTAADVHAQRPATNVPQGDPMHLAKPLKAAVVAATLAAGMPAASGAELVRHRTPGSDFPILMAVEVPAGYKTIYLSGVVPSVADATKPAGTLEAYGDTRTQTASVLRNIERNLKRIGLTLGAVIKMQVFLVGDPAQQGRMDFKGMMAAYTEAFGTTAQPNLPTRSVVQVVGLANPGWLVEIEVVAAVREK